MVYFQQDDMFAIIISNKEVVIAEITSLLMDFIETSSIEVGTVDILDNGVLHYNPN